MSAIVTINKRYGYVVVKCPLGHLIEARKLDKTFGGSHLEADLASRHPGDRWDRMAAQCRGSGHEQPAVA